MHGERVGDDHDDHGHVEGGERGGKREAAVVNHALVAVHDVGRVDEPEGADWRAD